MFSQSADKPAADESTAPIGMRELPPQPAKPVMPTYGTATPASPEPAPEPTEAGPGPDDSVIAKDDHLEGTFTSRGTVVVMGSVKGRIEAVQIRIEDGASVDADVIVDEAIIAGEFTGNLTCRERLEARASGRINGRVETFKLMLHEGASVEGEMHMLTEAPKDASETIRGNAPLRGDAADADDKKPDPRPAAPATATPSVTPASDAKPTSAVGSSTSATGAGSTEASAVRSSVVETLKAESARVVTPRTSTTTRGYGYSGAPVERERKSTTSSGF
jgi:cytoskeletal protein CcmA (bactofilin family)